MENTTPVTASSSVQSVRRAAMLLRCFADDETDSATLTTLSRRTGLNISTAHRLLRTLCAEGLLTHDADTERYSPGPALLRLGSRTYAQSGLSKATRELHDLVASTGESSSLGVRDGKDVRVVIRVESVQPLRFDRPPGSRVPLHCSAMGKALLAYGAESIADAIRSAQPLQARTPRTITSIRHLESDLRQARRRGHTFVDEEQHLGLRSIGVPVLDAHGVAWAAVAVQGPTSRITDDRVEDISGLICEVAARLTEIPGLEMTLASAAVFQL